MNPPPPASGPALVLASTSPYRRELLTRLGLPFSTVAPLCDESPLAGESAPALAARLAAAKAHSVAGTLDGQALVIGSDQVADLDGEIYGKPGDRAGAIAQLGRAAGRVLSLFTAVCLLDAASGEAHAALVSCDVHFRDLSARQIAAYVDAEEPFDCAGSFRVEGLGISLLERVETEDPTAIVGLPLIALSALLRDAGLDPLG